MKTKPLEILILDDNTLIVGPLSKYLNEKFGSRINITSFFDADKCLRNIHEQTYVIILNYFLSDREKTTKSRFSILHSIQKEHPGTDVMVITSNGDLALATEAMQKKASEFVLRCERLSKNKMFVTG